MFDGKVLFPTEIIVKIQEETELWFLADQQEKESELENRREQAKLANKWVKPPATLIKCNIGLSFSRGKKMGGGDVLGSKGP